MVRFSEEKISMKGKLKSGAFILILILLSACDSSESSGYNKTEWNDKEKYLESLKTNPWQLDGDLACDYPLPEWHHCSVPSVIRREHIRRRMHDSLACKSEEKRESVAAILTSNPDACESEVLVGYDEAIVRYLTPRVEAMRAKQGNQLPHLTEEQLAECSIDKASLLNDPPIVYERAARLCMWRLK